jgi:hypothetical protein
MSIGWVLFFVIVLVLAYLGIRRLSTTSEGSTEAKPLTTMAGMGFGIIILGLLVLLMPSTSARIAALPNVTSDAYAILVGISYLLGVFIVLAGVGVLFVREKTE